MTTSWITVDDNHCNTSDFSAILMNQSNLPQATITPDRPAKGKLLWYSLDMDVRIFLLFSHLVLTRLASLFAPTFRSSTAKPLISSVKFINPCIRDMDRLSGPFS